MKSTIGAGGEPCGLWSPTSAETVGNAQGTKSRNSFSRFTLEMPNLNAKRAKVYRECGICGKRVFVLHCVMKCGVWGRCFLMWCSGAEQHNAKKCLAKLRGIFLGFWVYEEGFYFRF